MKMWTVWIRDQTETSVQSDLDLHCPQKLVVLSTVRKELITFKWENFENFVGKGEHPGNQQFLLFPH